mmetsp:Transcript_157000/g.500758  ORF Transcript_157000/g.500758 Transcript_157000/m.500758 type:complete len:89 (+) Transcript_157000:76-342(+)
MTGPRNVEVDGSGGEAARLERGREFHQEPRDARDETSEELRSTDAKSEMGRRMCCVMIVKEARAGAGDRRRLQKVVECENALCAHDVE